MKEIAIVGVPTKAHVIELLLSERAWKRLTLIEGSEGRTEGLRGLWERVLLWSS